MLAPKLRFQVSEWLCDERETVIAYCELGRTNERESKPKKLPRLGSFHNYVFKSFYNVSLVHFARGGLLPRDLPG